MVDDRAEHGAGNDESRGRRGVDPGSLVIGVWFAGLGFLATVLSGEVLRDLPRVAIPVSFAVTGLALLLPSRHRPTRAEGPGAGSSPPS